MHVTAIIVAAGAGHRIGANTAIFSFVNAILIRPLPYPESDRLVFLTEWSEQIPNMSFSVANFEDVRDQNRVFEEVVAFRGQDYVLTGEGDAERLAQTAWAVEIQPVDAHAGGVPDALDVLGAHRPAADGDPGETRAVLALEVGRRPAGHHHPALRTGHRF